MLRLVLLAERTLGVLRALGVALVCALGLVILARALDRHYPVANWLVWELLPIWGYTLLFNAACVSGGAGLVRLVLGNRRPPALEWLLLSMATGLVLFVLGMFLSGALCRFRPMTACVLPGLMLVLGFPGARALLGELRRHVGSALSPGVSWRVASFLATGFGVTCLVFLYLEAFRTSSINFDASWYHYPIAQDYARTHCIVPFPGEHHRAFPHLTSIIHTWALLVPGLEPLPTRWMLSLHLEYSIVVWRVVAVATAIAWMLDWKRTPGLWAVFFLFPSLFVYDQNIGASADHFLGFFAVPIALAAARTLRRFEWRWAVLLGVLMGGHLLTKYQAVYLLAGTTLVCVLRWGYLLVRHLLARRRARSGQQRSRLRRLLLGPATAIAVTMLVSSPHFLKNWVFYNNPVYPYGQSVFKHSDPAPEPTPAGTKQREAFGPQHSGIARQLWVGKLLYEYSLSTRNRNLTDKTPYMGSLFSLLLPCLIFVRRPRRIWFVAGLGALCFFVWANTAANDRYLLSFYDLFIASSGALLARAWELGWLARAGIVPLTALQLFWGGDAMLFYGAKRLKETIDTIAQGYAGKSIDARLGDQGHQQAITAATPRNAVILSRNYKGFLGLDRNLISDIRAAQFYVSYTGLRSSAELWAYLRQRDVTHLLYPDGQRVPVRLNNAILFAALFHHHAVDVKHFGSLVLGTLPERAPAASAPLRVLLRKVKFYSDGLYEVQELDVDENRPSSLPRPVPEPRFSDENAAQLLEQADVVVLGKGARISSAAQDRLDNEFKSVERFDTYTLHLRRQPKTGDR